MSCETRHRAIIVNLLTLAGLTDTVDADTVIRSGSGRRRRQRGEPRGSDHRRIHDNPLGLESLPLLLHDDVRTAMGITGHGADTLPAWVPALIDLLVCGANTNNRRARLTLHLLTGGWDAVTPHLTDHDRAWLHTAAHIGLAPPAAVATRLVSLPAAAPISRTLSYLTYRVVERTTILDALFGIDAVPPAAVQSVTSRQVLQVAVGGPFTSRTDLQAVLRAVLADTPAATQALRLVPNRIGTVFRLTTVPPSVSPRPAAWTEQGIALVLADAAARIRAANGLALDPTALRDPSAEVIAAICDALAPRLGSVGDLGLVLAALMHLWRTEGREDAVTATFRHLEPIVAQGSRLDSTLGTALLAAGAVAPPHGDAVFTQIGVQDYHTTVHAWAALAGTAVYAAACQQHGHRPTVDGLADLVRTRWRTRTSTVDPSPIPLLAVGREREFLLPIIHADSTRRDGRLLDCIDAMAMLALVGGDTDGFRAVLLDAVMTACDPLDPQIVIRLAADRDGQDVLARLSSVPTLPVWTAITGGWSLRLIPHLASPAWMTAPPPLRTWWEDTLQEVVASPTGADFLGHPLPLYPTVAPQVAVVHPNPTIALAERAVAHPAWATLPTTERRACLTRVFRSGWDIGDVLPIVARAATPAAMADIQVMLPHASSLTPDEIHALQVLIDDDLRRSS